MSKFINVKNLKNFGSYKMDYEENSVSSLDHVSVIYHLCNAVTPAMKTSRHKFAECFRIICFNFILLFISRIYNCRRDEEEDVSSYWMILRKQEDMRN
jgi:hypothetical protein